MTAFQHFPLLLFDVPWSKDEGGGLFHDDGVDTGEKGAAEAAGELIHSMYMHRYKAVGGGDNNFAVHTYIQIYMMWCRACSAEMPVGCVYNL